MVGCLVAKWWTADLEVPGSGSTGNRIFLFGAHSANFRRRVTFVSLGWDIKLSVPGYLVIYFG